MKTIRTCRRYLPALVFAGVLGLLANLAISQPAAAIEGAVAGVASQGDVPLHSVWNQYGPYAFAYAGKGTYNNGGSANLNLNIPGPPVAAFLYISGTDMLNKPGTHFPAGDQNVKVVITNAAGTKTYTNVPVPYQAGTGFVNRLDISGDVVEGANAIAISRYNLNYPEGAIALAVYETGLDERNRVEIFEGADAGWYPRNPPFGPDSEVVIFSHDPVDFERQGRVLMALGGMMNRRGDEVFFFSGQGDPATRLPDSDGDGLFDIVDRRWALKAYDGAPLRNDWTSDAKSHREAVAGAVSLEEDKLGKARSSGGYSYGTQLDIYDAPYRIPAGSPGLETFSAFQVQSEDPEDGDSFNLFLMVNAFPVPEGLNPIPNIVVTKAPKLTTGAPGLQVDFTFTVTAAGGEEALRDVQLTDDPVLAITGPDPGGDADADGELDLGETWVFHASAVFPDPGSFPDVVTALGTGVESGLPVDDTDDALVVVTPPPEPDFTIAKTASIEIGTPGDLVAYEFTLTNTGGVPLVDVAVVDDVLGDLGPVTLGVGEVRKLYVYFHPLPECGLSGATLDTACSGEVFAANACSLTNTVTATWDGLTRTAWDCVDIRTPDFTIEKTASIESGMPGDPVTYEFTVTNTGKVRLVDVAVVDDVLGDLGSVTLEVGASTKLYAYDHPLPACGQGGATLDKACSGAVFEANVCSLKNTVTAAWDGLTRSAWDCVDIRIPGIMIVKTVDPTEAYPGETVTYTFTVTNTGALPLVDVRVTDPKLNPVAPHVIHEIALLQPGAASAVTFTRQFVAPACSDERTDEGPCPEGWAGCNGAAGADALAVVAPVDLCHMTNVATVVGTAGGREVTDDDDACITILPLKRIGDTVWLDRDKDGAQDDGEPGIPGITVTLTLPGGGTVTAVTGELGKYLFTGLKAGAYTVTPTGPAGFELTTGNVPLGVTLGRCDLEYLDADFGYWVEPRIAVTKAADPTFGYLCKVVGAWPGEIELTPLDVTYTFVVTNPGMEALRDVTVVDAVSGTPQCTDPVRTAREGDDELLDPGEGWTYEQSCTYSEAGVFPDTVTASGWGAIDGVAVDDIAPASVEAVDGGICLGKVATLTLRYDGATADAQVLVVARDNAFDDGVAFEGIVQPGESFSFGPLYGTNPGFDGTLGTEIHVYVNGELATEIHTSCSQPIYPGQAWGIFTVIAGTSKNGGALCPIR